MSKARMEQMLQECLDGYEAGLTPEECLSAYPERRRELEPLLRQALSLRVAYASSLSDEFRFQAREQLMFAAGRDVKLALARDPGPDFILQERRRFLNVAGASAQEALRDVPPPRLAFWVNARRRFLDAAANTTPAPARRFGNMLRYSVAATAVAVVLSFVAFASFNGGAKTDSPEAQLAALEEQVSSIEQRNLQGDAIEVGELESLAEKTSLITETLDDQDFEQAQKVGGLILRQQKVIETQGSIGDTQLAETQQKLEEAQQKLDGSTSPSPTAVAAIVSNTEEPAVTATDEPAEPSPTPAPLAPGEVRVEASSDTTAGLTWKQITTEDLSFRIPDSWRLRVDPDENGVLTQTGSYLAFETGGENPIFVLITKQGQTQAQVKQVSLQLRGPGADGDTIAAETLADFGEVGLLLHNFVLSITLTDNP
jgi:hypothetical protein